MAQIVAVVALSVVVLSEPARTALNGTLGGTTSEETLAGVAAAKAGEP